jgi:HSP20 family protein
MESDGYVSTDNRFGRYGSFYRSIPLPEGIKSEEAKANFRDGVLEISMPSPQRESRQRQISIT